MLALSEPAVSTSYKFAPEASYLTVEYKQQLLKDWVSFIHNGFHRMFWTQQLYRFLTNHCTLLSPSSQHCWEHYFNSDVFYLKVFLNQFGGNHLSVQFSTIAWLGGSGIDLKQQCALKWP
jgi:hypothetical protein